jgi:tRNA1(Val) A37 N6-methylase TrmN6
MPYISLVNEAHQIIARHLSAGSLAIDATTGNGQDSVFLAQLVGNKGHVYGFDIQETAITSTRKRLQQAQLIHRVTLFQAGHENLAILLPDEVICKINAICFNLGYLPGTDKKIITLKQTTNQALAAACQFLATPGCITIIAYPGHTGGKEETAAIYAFCKQLDCKLYEVNIMTVDNCQNQPPILFVITKITQFKPSYSNAATTN